MTRTFVWKMQDCAFLGAIDIHLEVDYAADPIGCKAQFNVNASYDKFGNFSPTDKAYNTRVLGLSDTGLRSPEDERLYKVVDVQVIAAFEFEGVVDALAGQIFILPNSSYSGIRLVIPNEWAPLGVARLLHVQYNFASQEEEVIQAIELNMV